jgi:peptidylprolyl isomerase
MMRRAQQGDKVTIQYIGTLDNGRIFHSTTDEAPMVFTIGDDQVFPALEREVVGMAVGEAKNFTVPFSEAYGPRLVENVLTLERASLPPGPELKVGQILRIEFGERGERVMQVTALGEAQVTLDGNHPLAGLDLTFALRLDAID